MSKPRNTLTGAEVQELTKHLAKGPFRDRVLRELGAEENIHGQLFTETDLVNGGQDWSDESTPSLMGFVDSWLWESGYGPKLCGTDTEERKEALLALSQAVYDRAVHETRPQWQSIDTAPKDGVLLMWNRTSGAVLGYWLAARSAGSPCWWEVNGFAIYPTHWMPLPDPPAAIRAAASPEREP